MAEQRRGEGAGVRCSPPTGPPAHVLVVDDDPALRSMLTGTLERAGHRVTAVADAEAALAAAQPTAPDLVLLDVVLEHTDGFAVLELLRSRTMHGLADVPVLFMSGYADTASRARAFELGASDFLAKPFGDHELTTRVAARLEAARLQRELTEHAAHTDEQASTSMTRLREREALQSTLLDTLPDAVFLKDAGGVFQLANAAFERLLGIEPGSAVGRRDEELTAPFIAARWREVTERALASDEPLTIAHELTSPQGEPRQLETRLAVVRGLDGHPLGVLGIGRDITERARMQRELAAFSAHLREAQELAGFGSWTRSVAGPDLVWSEQTYRIFGLEPGTPVDNERFVALVHPDDRAEVDAAWAHALETGDYRVDHRIVVDGEVRWVREHARFELDQGDASRIIGTVLDITAQRAVEERLARERAHLADALDATGGATWVLDVTTGSSQVDERWWQLVRGCPPDDEPMSFERFRRWVHVDDREAISEAVARLRDNLEAGTVEVTYRTQHLDGRWVTLRDRGRVVESQPDGRPRLVRGVVVDITSQMERQAELSFAADHDGLTGLANRQRFVDELSSTLEDCHHEQRGATLLSIDLDGFESVNATLGRAAGNQLLLAIAERLVTLVGRQERVARTGGDEFAILLPGVTDPKVWRPVAEEIRRTIAKPVRMGPERFSTTGSIGVTVMPADRLIDAEQLLRQADQALYLAKVSGKDRAELFDVASEQRRRERYAALREIRTGLRRGELVLHYHPKVELRSGTVVGFEALVRWQHPERGLLPPGAFIPLLEGDRLAVEVGDAVIEQALAQLTAWNAEGLRTQVSVNVDTMQLHDPGFLERLTRQLAAAPEVDPEQLGLEILETGALADLDHVAGLVTELEARGHEVALDDFGTGFSSLTFVKQLTARTLKIDRSFVMDLFTDPDSAIIVHSIVGLGRDFRRLVLAEGIESDEHGELLVELGCTHGQGFAITRPLPADEVPGWLASWRAPLSWQRTQTRSDRVPSVLAEVEHRAWLRRIDRHLAGRQQVLPDLLDEHRCQLGAWLARVRAGTDTTAVCALDQLHVEVHRTARRALAAHELGDQLEADAVHEQLVLLSDDLLELLRSRTLLT